jgi:hypothetical protein
METMIVSRPATMITMSGILMNALAFRITTRPRTGHPLHSQQRMQIRGATTDIMPMIHGGVAHQLSVMGMDIILHTSIMRHIIITIRRRTIMVMDMQALQCKTGGHEILVTRVVLVEQEELVNHV